MITRSRKVKLFWKRNLTAYAEANKKVLVDEGRKIGSAVTSANKMMANGEEQKAYMKTILGVSANSPDWDKAVANYWHSLSVIVPPYEDEFEIGFVYDITNPETKDSINEINKGISAEDKKLKTDESLYNYISNRLKAVEDNYKKQLVEAASIPDEKTKADFLRNAYSIKWDSIVSIESEHYKVGRPINVEQYILYRYCLVYRDVANEISMSDKSPYIRFYLHSEEEARLAKERIALQEKERMKVFLKVSSSEELMENLLFAAGKGTSVKEAKDSVDMVMLLKQFSEDDASKFVSLANDTNLTVKGKIEKYVIYGILRRLPNTEILVDSSDASVIVGNNLNDAITYITDTQNKALVSEWEAKFKGLIKTKVVKE